MIGCAVGLLFRSPVAAVLLAGAGAFFGHLYDELHAEPVEPLDPALDPFRDVSGEPAPTGADGNEEGPTPPRPRRAVRPPARGPGATADAAEGPASSRAGGGAEGQQRAELARVLCPLFVELARADGDVSRDEVRAIREHFEHTLRFDSRALNTVRNQLKAAIASEPDLDAVCRRAQARLPVHALPDLVDALYTVALADGALQRSEHDALRRICRALEVDADAQARIAQQHLGGGERAFAELGIEADASNEEIRSAFRRLAAQHHPDRVAQQGPAAVEASSRRFQRIKDAYEELRKLRGV